jgi:hypothetical protein
VEVDGFETLVKHAPASGLFWNSITDTYDGYILKVHYERRVLIEVITNATKVLIEAIPQMNK